MHVSYILLCEIDGMRAFAAMRVCFEAHRGVLDFITSGGIFHFLKAILHPARQAPHNRLESGDAA